MLSRRLPLIVLPWRAPDVRQLSDTMRVTYEVIIALAWANDRRATPPLTWSELADVRGVTLRTLTRHIRYLEAGRFIRVTSERAQRWTLWPRHLSGVEFPQEIRPTLPISVRFPDAQGSILVGSESDRPSKEEQQLPATPSKRENALDEEARGRLLRRLVGLGVYASVARELVGLPWMSEVLVERWWHTLSVARGLRSPAALLVKILRDPNRCLPMPSASEVPPLEEQEEVPASAPEEGEEDEAPPALPFDWSRVLDRLRDLPEMHSILTMLEPSRPISYDGNCLVVAVRSAMVADWLSRTADRTLRQVVRETVGQPLRLLFVAARIGQLDDC